MEGDAAEEAGDYARAFRSFTRGAARGNRDSELRLAYLHDVGKGTVQNKGVALAMYRRAWRVRREPIAANNIAIICRERGKLVAMVAWFRRAAEAGDGDCYLELARCYRFGSGVRRSDEMALRCLAIALASDCITEFGREKAEAMMESFRPKLA